MSNYNDTFDAWIEAFTLLKKYEKRIEIYAGHERICLGPYGASVGDIDLEDQLRMQELGWFVEEDSFVKLV